VTSFIVVLLLLDFYKFVFQFSREGTNKTIGTCIYMFILNLFLLFWG
jgi:hypothetical protein